MKSHTHLKKLLSYLWSLLIVLQGVFLAFTVKGTIWYWWLLNSLLLVFIMMAAWSHGSVTATIILEEEELDRE